ncbi:hypothetical protein [Serratia quinivorans]|uniref:hypothetical protein n=1 Tax=Serratia quinivorans TaxID=137545 RepID=UPI002E75B8FB|nr:hypothetical protein [Serratia quinivorans]
MHIIYGRAFNIKHCQLNGHQRETKHLSEGATVNQSPHAVTLWFHYFKQVINTLFSSTTITHALSLPLLIETLFYFINREHQLSSRA